MEVPMMFFGIILIGVILYLALRERPEGRMRDDEPLETLRRRYAMGAIDREEFLRMKEELTS
jgi:uncharacterized membrane protein